MMPRWSEQELRDYTAAAEGDDHAAQVWLGWAYWEGELVPRDLGFADFWLTRASQSGDPEAMFRFAMFCHATGRHDEVPVLLEAAAEKGYAPASFVLGSFLAHGKIVPQNIGRALTLWRDAADRGHIPAEAQLVKADMRAAPLFFRPFIWLRLIPITVRAAHLSWRNPRDARVFGV